MGNAYPTTNVHVARTGGDGVEPQRVGGCATSGRLDVRTGPPAPRAEAHRTAPGPGFVWIDGHYRWDGRAYVWSPGRWERRPRANARWMAGRWVHSPRGWYWIEGHWR